VIAIWFLLGSVVVGLRRTLRDESSTTTATPAATESPAKLDEAPAKPQDLPRSGNVHPADPVAREWLRACRAGDGAKIFELFDLSTRMLFRADLISKGMSSKDADATLPSVLGQVALEDEAQALMGRASLVRVDGETPTRAVAIIAVDGAPAFRLSFQQGGGRWGVHLGVHDGLLGTQLR
jgi:hypothetical protein